MSLVLAIQLFLKQLLQSVETLIRITLLSKWFSKQKNTAQTNDIVILGNGPSLPSALSNHPQLLKARDLLAVNHFASTDLFEKVRPIYYIFSAPDLWLDNIESHFIDQSKTLFDHLAARTRWKLQLFVPFEARKHKRWQNQLAENSLIEIRFYNNTPCEGWRWWRHYTFRRGLGMPRPHNVMIPSLMMALSIGYKKIFLLGADHSWLSEISVDSENRALIKQKHFYDESYSSSKPLDKRGKGERRLHEILQKFMLAFRGYFIIREYADSRGIAILNATDGSFIDAFDRIAPENVQ